MAEASALDAVVCGACWHDGRGTETVACEWCGELDSPWHRHWACSRLQAHASEEVKRTQWMRDELFSETSPQSWAACLWGRAILPMTLGRYKQEAQWADDLQARQTNNFEAMARDAEDFATDGSGGPGYVPKELKKVGSVVAIVN